MPRVNGPKVRWWQFTYFLREAEDEQPEESFTEASERLRVLLQHHLVVYAVWNHEECPTTGRKHLQGCFKLSQGRKFDFVLRHLVPDTTHVEPARCVWTMTDGFEIVDAILTSYY